MDSQILLWIKAVVFLFILSTPFYDVGKAFAFANTFVIKLILLLAVVGASFIDMHLALLCAIAFFILILNFSYSRQPTAAKRPPIVTLPKIDLSHTVVSTPSASASGSTAPKETITVPEIPLGPMPSHTMSEFPEVKCVTPVEANDAFMNSAIEQHTLDEKIKPYEAFISQLTNEEFLDIVSNSAYLKP